jgi:hypothetical protein
MMIPCLVRPDAKESSRGENKLLALAIQRHFPQDIWHQRVSSVLVAHTAELHE